MVRAIEGSTVVVTGAGGGIGRGIALRFAMAGARVAALDIDRVGAEETAAMIPDGIAIACDTADPASIEAARLEVERAFGPVDTLVNNAGIMGAGGALIDLSLEDWNRLLSINLTGYFLCAQAFGRGMLARGSGSAVHVVSITAQMPLPFTGNYGVAKAGAAMLSKLLAAEWGPRGVRSNAVHPGLVRTPMTQGSYDVKAVAEARGAAVPWGRAAEPADIAGAALFLASPEAEYLNGAELLVDGGLAQNLGTFIPRA